MLNLDDPLSDRTAFTKSRPPVSMEPDAELLAPMRSSKPA
jgi:hypothetical protein